MAGRYRQRFRLETLNIQHSVQNFRCEEDEINEYLHEEALADMNRNVARTCVEIDQTMPITDNVAGFFTLRAHSLRIDESYFDDATNDIIEDQVGILPIEVPLVELMWLARDLRWRGEGMGDTLMIDALKTVAQATDRIGMIGLHLRSTPYGVPLYERFDFQQFKEHPHFDRLRYILPTHVIRAITDRQVQVEKLLQPDKRRAIHRFMKRHPGY